MIESFDAGVFAVDFEFHPVAGVEGNPPDPVCMVVKDLHTGQVYRYSKEDLSALERAPLSVGPDALWIAYYAAAEMDCFLSLGWDLPTNVLDLYVEFKNFRNGLSLPHGSGLLGALAHYGLLSIAPEEKEAMRDLILSRGPWTSEQEQAILDYCQSDVDALAHLFSKMAPLIDWPRALLRGRYIKAVSRIQDHGIPIDVSSLTRI